MWWTVIADGVAHCSNATIVYGSSGVGGGWGGVSSPSSMAVSTKRHSPGTWLVSMGLIFVVVVEMAADVFTDVEEAQGVLGCAPRGGVDCVAGPSAVGDDVEALGVGEAGEYGWAAPNFPDSCYRS